MTAVEWLIEQLKINNYISDNAHWLINDAKEMEKQQIIDAFWNGDNTDCLAEQNAKEFAEQYYNKKFNK